MIKWINTKSCKQKLKDVAPKNYHCASSCGGTGYDKKNKTDEHISKIPSKPAKI